MATTAACVFCNPEASRVVFTDELVFGYWDGFPVTPGHILVITRRHVASWFEATADEHAALVLAFHEARRLVEARDRVDGWNLGVNVGRAGGQTVDHLHVHLIPRRTGDVPNPRGGVRHVIPGKGDYPGSP